MKKKDINALIDCWQQAGQISGEQAAYMKTDVATVTSEKSGHQFISAIMYIGATGLSLGALLLIASNWEGLSRPIKVVLALLLPIIPLCFAYWQLIMKGTTRVLGQAANVFGLALVGGSLAIIGQTYNLESDMVSFLWTWAILTFPFIFVFRRKENVLFSATIIGVASLYALVEYLDATDMDEGALLLLLTLASLGYAGIMYGIGNMLGTLSSWTETSRLLRLGAASLATITLFITTFNIYAQEITGDSFNNQTNWEVLSFGFNLFFIGFLVFVLLRTIRLEEYSYAFGVVRLFGIYLIVKYITLFYSMLDTGLFFMIGGIIFITGGWFLEKKKSLLLSYMRETHETST